MTPARIREILTTMESSLPVADWNVDGVPVWPVFRIWFVFAHDEFVARAAVESKTLLEASTDRLTSLARGLGHFLGAAISDHQHHQATGRADVAFFTHTTCRVFQADGRWYDQFCEPITEMLDERGFSSALFEHAPRNQYRVPRSRRSQLVQPMMSAIALGNSLLPSSRLMPGEREIAAYFAAHLPELVLDLQTVRQRVHAIPRYARYFSRKLARVRPRVAFVVNYYDVAAMAFIFACRQLGIPTVDLQHGVQGELHLAYSSWTSVPPTGYALLPTVFWCWSEADAATIRAWSEPVARWHRPLVAGNLIVAKFMRDEDALVQTFDRDVRSKAGTANILVTLRPGAGLPPLIRAAIEASPTTWTWWIRLHPAMLDERPAIDAALAELIGSRVVVEEATRLPLYALLRVMDCHLTEISSTVLEADQFGVPSVLCHPTGVEYYASVVRVAVGAFTAHEIVTALAAQLDLDLPRLPVVAIDGERLVRLVTSGV